MSDTFPADAERPRPLVVFGSGGQAKDTISYLHDLPRRQWDLIGILDDDQAMKGARILDVPVLGGREWFATVDYKPDAFLAVGDPVTRCRLAAELRPLVSAFPSLVHPGAILNLRHTQIGEGCFIGPAAVVSGGASIGRFVILHATSTVNHDTRIDDFCMLSTGVNLGGASTLEEGVFMGINSATLPGITVGRYAVVGGGAVCIDDVAAGAVMAGVPARPVRKRPTLP